MTQRAKQRPSTFNWVGRQPVTWQPLKQPWQLFWTTVWNTVYYYHMLMEEKEPTNLEKWWMCTSAHLSLNFFILQYFYQPMQLLIGLQCHKCPLDKWNSWQTSGTMSNVDKISITLSESPPPFFPMQCPPPQSSSDPFGPNQTAELVKMDAKGFGLRASATHPSS